MGLITATGKHISTNDVSNNYADDDGDDEEEEEEEAEEAEAAEAADSDGRPLQHVQSSIQHQKMPRNNEVNLPTDDLLEGVVGGHDQHFYTSETIALKVHSTDQIPRSKKRKKNDGEGLGSKILGPGNDSGTKLQPSGRILSAFGKTETASVTSASTRPKRNTNLITSVSALELEVNRTPKHRRAYQKKQAGQLSGAQFLSPENANHATTNAAAAILTRNKRKSTTETEAEENDGAIAGTASRRAKRVALDRTGPRNDDGNQLMAQLPKQATRSFRMRKK
jgi:hypothetical protein